MISAADRFGEARRVALSHRLEDAWNAMVAWFAQQAEVERAFAFFEVEQAKE